MLIIIFVLMFVLTSWHPAQEKGSVDAGCYARKLAIHRLVLAVFVSCFELQAREFFGPSFKSARRAATPYL
jgi:hypothetical protein